MWQSLYRPSTTALSTVVLGNYSLVPLFKPLSMPPILADLFGEIESELSGGKPAKVPERGDPFSGHAWVKGVPDSLRHKSELSFRRWLGECLGRMKSYVNDTYL